MAGAAEQLLTGPVKDAPAWLGTEACAAAVGYTPQVRHYVLERMGTITNHPPFTNQLTYPEDMARFTRELAEAKAASADPRLRQAARATIAAAVARDPDNPDLAKLEGEIADDLGDVAGALAAAERAARLQPYAFSLPTDRAIKLARLGRFAEAEQLLRATAARAVLRDQVTMAPAFVDLFIRTKRLDEGRRHLADLLARVPGEATLLLQRGRLERLAGEPAAAEQTYRDLLAARPADTRALEALVGLLTEAGRTTAVAEATFAAADHQPGNQANNLRAALLSDQRGAAADELRFLLAAERSGPVNSALELRLARKLAAAGRPQEALQHLAEARRLSLYEGDPAMTESITQLIAQLRAPAT
jgi:predicted Zn-dependent protease